MPAAPIVPEDLKSRLARVRGIVLDVDGVLTDGSMTFDESGHETKTFDVKDGLGLVLLRDLGYRIGIVSSRTSKVVAHRCAELKIPDEHLLQGERDKVAAFDLLTRRWGLDAIEIVAVGDDLPDLGMLRRAGDGAAPADAPRCLSTRALSTPEPLVRAFSRRVQQEGALDLTQGDYKNADFAPHPEVVRAARRITRNTVHSYGPAVGRMDVRSEIAEFFNRDGLLDYPASDVRFLPDEVIFTPGTRSGLAMVLEVLGTDGSGVVVPRPSWEYDWFIERAGKHVVELPTTPPDFLPDPAEFERLLEGGGISSVIVNNPHNPTGRVYPRALVEELVRVASKHFVYVLYDSVYQRLDYVGSFVNPAFADPANAGLTNEPT